MTTALDPRVLGHQRRLDALRGELLGANYLIALKAMDAAMDLHTGVRKDGFTPEFDHQVAIARYVLTLTPSLVHPQETLAAVFLHDAPEDYGISIAEVAELTSERVAEAVWCLTKVFRDEKRDAREVFDSQARNLIASVVKGGDRMHNQHTAVGVFSLPKVASYVEETEEWIMPMLKEARRRFPEQDKAYQNIRSVLRTQLQMLKAISAPQA